MRRTPLLATLSLLVLPVLGHPAPGAAQTAGTDGYLPEWTREQMQRTGKEVLDHSVYDDWRRLDDRMLSRDGRWITFRYVPGDGDAELVIRRTDSDELHSIPRGGAATLTPDGGFAVFLVEPALDTVRELRRAETPADELPGDTLTILALGQDPAAAVRIPDVTGFRTPEDGGAFVAYLLEEEDEPADEGEPEAEEEEAPAEPAAGEAGDDEAEDRPDRGKGQTLVLRALASGTEWRFEDVKDYRFTPDGSALVFLRVTESGEGDGAFAVSTAQGAVRPLFTGMGRYTGLAVSDENGRVAFLTDAPDWASDAPTFTLMVADAAAGSARAVADAGTAALPTDWVVSEHGPVRFSRTGRRVFFGTAPPPLPEPDEDILPEDRVELDIWNWKDPYLQPMQLVQRERELERSYLAVVHLRDGDRVVQLGTEEVPDVEPADEGEGDWALGTSDLPYRQLVSWDGRYNDVYAVNVRTGTSRMVREGLRGFGGGFLSPAGRYITWWDEEETSWMAAPAAGGEPVNLSADIPFPTWDVLDDHPQGLPPEAFPQWTEGDREVLVADRYDLWVVDPATGDARSLTEGQGRETGMRFRYIAVDPEERAVPRDQDIHLWAFHLTTKATGIYRDRVQGGNAPRQVVYGDRWYDPPLKAQEADRYIVSWGTFRDYPEYRATDASLQGGRVLSDTNPQQERYSWGTAELVDWTSADGTPLQGILYRPEDFDPSLEYPMMVYFYERSSDGLHRHRTPQPGGSSIDFPFYVSRGYLLFVPDIPYKIGWPGESAMNAVVPGVLSLVDEGFVDRENIGVQGHSWGGYQIAYMVTRSNIFAAAEAGAPVSNMTSAYGGIRWASGMSRMFQYERTQSRIGGTLWDAQHRYIENSPLFQADKVETPVLMMHNDEDGAVPWYQGIEYFVALRRLGKPVWMLNYNGEAHGLRERQNREDWAIRMQQFFDHYLMDAPPPVWMEEGVPAVMKGRSLGLELVTPSRPVSEEDGEAAAGG